jgi:5-methylcytosine-specific restriction endonuclease McrA
MAAQRKAYSDPVYRSIPTWGQCETCGVHGELTRDHIVPLIAGGTNERANIRLLCRSCNSSKGKSSAE